ncbi:MAG: MBL fold metallo-hydrolase [Candidatus Pacebacteria bacterium]|nr:MBL fold metallo-hydrolase [Candidatus Paceibacterota bacterium]PIR60023.1 MAG: hypothetical protein COU67_03735 [Candidatus Pacebacteria bacterium CG10_big_fil_rev_8_21_14_0_10_44_54]
MQITYHGHSTFKLKGKLGSVVTDPYNAEIGLQLSTLSADIVTVSHAHADHNAFNQIKTTARRSHPFVVEKPGEYEVGGISVFGVPTFHDDAHGSERGLNTVFTILLDELRVCHLGDLGHELTTTQQEAIGSVDILLCPVGGVFTLDPKQAIKVIRTLEPSIVIPMHFRTEKHDPTVFSELATREDFVAAFGSEAKEVEKLEVSRASLPEETELTLLLQT